MLMDGCKLDGIKLGSSKIIKLDTMENMNSGNFNFPTTEYPQVSQERRSSRESRASSNNHLNMTYQTPSVRNIESHGQGKRTMTNLCRRDKERSSRGLGGTQGDGRSTGGQEGRRGVVTTSPESSYFLMLLMMDRVSTNEFQ